MTQSIAYQYFKREWRSCPPPGKMCPGNSEYETVKAFICQYKGGDGQECGAVLHPDTMLDNRGRKSPASLRSHLNQKHQGWNAKLSSSACVGQKRIAEYPMTVQKKDDFRSPEENDIAKLVELFIDHNWSYQSVIRQTTKRMMRDHCPSLGNPPTRQSLARYVRNFAQADRQEIIKLLKYQDSIVLVSDIWSTKDKKSFLLALAMYIDASWSLRCHLVDLKQLEESYTGENIRKAFEEILEEAHISYDKLGVIATDSGPNMKIAVRELSQLSDTTPIVNLPCLAHCINNAVSKGLFDHQEIGKLMNHVRDFSTFMSSETMTRWLKSAQEKKNRRTLRAIQVKGIRWHTYSDMVDRFLELLPDYREVTSCISDENALPPSQVEYLSNTVNNEDFIAKVEALARILRDVRFFARKVEGHGANALSTFLLVYYHLTKYYLVSSDQDNTLVKDFKKTCKEYIEEFVSRDQFAAASLAFVLDPRCVRPEKSLFTNPPTGLQASVKEVRDWVKDIGFNDSVLGQFARLHWKSVVRKGKKIPDEIKHVDVGELRGNGDNQSGNEEEDQSSSDEEVKCFRQAVMDELKCFRSFSKNSSQEPLPFWKEHHEKFPLLAPVAKRFLPIPGSAAPAEQVFSIAGRVHSDRSCNMTAETLRAILTIKNSRLGWMDLARQPPSDAFDVNVDPFGENEAEMRMDEAEEVLD
eukprot:gb/GECG01005687.1/.p1 GENE.gb/GECG01005687.1/~~gb/GECG01005687.1/.p1  ORF type:complete len:696 (+),score=85.80 gb/GECG01005687.1/:1-2088(+)